MPALHVSAGPNCKLNVPLCRCACVPTRRQQARNKGGRAASQALCAQYFMSENAMEAVAAGRADYAATLADLGFVPRSYVDALRGQARGQVRGGCGA